MQNAKGDTALSIAASLGNLGVVRTLTTHGANINIANVEGKTALIQAVDTEGMVARRRDRTEIVKLLIEHHADLDVQDNKRQTALMLAAAKGYTEVVHMLLSGNADLFLKNCQGRTALQASCPTATPSVLFSLLERHTEYFNHYKDVPSAVVAHDALPASR